jgi:hypothetical protein
MSEGNVFDLIKKLRRMHGHVGKKDKAVVVEAIGALQDLALQRYNLGVAHGHEQRRTARTDAAVSESQDRLGAQD